MKAKWPYSFHTCQRIIDSERNESVLDRLCILHVRVFLLNSQVEEYKEVMEREKNHFFLINFGKIFL